MRMIVLTVLSSCVAVLILLALLARPEQTCAKFFNGKKWQCKQEITT